MQFIVSACTDVGVRKQVNQDSLNVTIADTKIGKVAMIVVCDGIGGLSSGEIASAQVVIAFKKWFANELPILIRENITNQKIEEEWKTISQNVHNKLVNYSQKHNIKLGTALTVILMAGGKYHIAQVGDSRAYEITKNISLLTNDQTVTEREVALGHITPQQAKCDDRRHILLQCIGAGNSMQPEFCHGDIPEEAVYLLCTDGFYDKLEDFEIFEKCNPQISLSHEVMENHLKELISWSKSRGEQDNISAVLLRTINE